MGLIGILIFLVYGAIVGWAGKLFLPEGQKPTGFWSTVAIGIAGSYVGGFINWLLGWDTGSPIQTSGLALGVVGAVVALLVWNAIKNLDTPQG